MPRKINVKKYLIFLSLLILSACGGSPLLITRTSDSSTPTTPTPELTTTTSTSLPTSITTSTPTTIKRLPRPLPTTTTSITPIFQTDSSDAAGFRTPAGVCLVTDLYTAERYQLTYDPSCMES